MALADSCYDVKGWFVCEQKRKEKILFKYAKEGHLLL